MTSLVMRLPLGGKDRQPLYPLPRLQIVWVLLSVSMSAFILNFALGGRFPALGYGLEMASCVSCGLSWLFARELFASQSKHVVWPYGLVSVFFVACVTLSITDQIGLERDGVLGFVGEVTKLVSSTVLLLPFFEAIDGFGRVSKAEQHFRRWFLIGYTALLGTATVLAIPAFAAIEHTGQVACCVAALLATYVAVQHRKRLIMARSSIQSRDHETDWLADQLTSLLIKDRVFLDPEIKVNHVARRLRQPDYKVTRCITQQLGFQNFNQMINAHRIEEAKRLLSDPKFDDQSILSIAMDSGFGSIGPFNRAFKQHTQQTPLAFRKSRRAKTVTA